MTTPAGWYDDGSGRQRWWDGQQWTEHFAPEAPAAPESSAAPEASSSFTEPETPAFSEAVAPAAESARAADEPPAEDAASDAAPVEETVVAPKAPRDRAAPAAPPVPPLPPVAQGGAPAYPGAAAPAYPAASGGYPPASGAYASPDSAAPGAYAAGGYPASAPYAAAAPYAASAPTGPAKPSVLGLVGLGLAALGLILAFFPLTLLFAWILLAAGFIVSLISVFLKGKKWPGFTGLGVSVAGAIIAFIMGFVFLFALAEQIDDSLPDPIPTTDTGTDEGTDEGTTPTEVVEGVMGEPVIITQMSGTSEVTITSANWSPTSDTGFAAENGGYLDIELTWTGIDGTTYVNPLIYFTAETAEGATGQYALFGDATIEPDELEAGETTQGTVPFDVPQSGSYVIIITDEVLQEVARVTVEPSAG
ncbi:DUF2510 domain-containing protein [Microbacterium sp. SA39]|uniref:DUF2510 domain-containing protein n=1 Tax=Microbacterium sp. SA39 TaxID=1263625 RepID=UPI0005FA3413|nr:DUF2510 domain-containing protein [Microbacterium sp. SA39]KJQ54601.1 hypothetical protein RS85_01755 [Microbacterium sp. SA39]